MDQRESETIQGKELRSSQHLGVVVIKKGSLRVTLDFGRQLYFYLFISKETTTNTGSSITSIGHSVFRYKTLIFPIITTTGYAFLPVAFKDNYA